MLAKQRELGTFEQHQPQRLLGCSECTLARHQHKSDAVAREDANKAPIPDL